MKAVAFVCFIGVLRNYSAGSLGAAGTGDCDKIKRQAEAECGSRNSKKQKEKNTAGFTAAVELGKPTINLLSMLIKNVIQENKKCRISSIVKTFVRR